MIDLATRREPAPITERQRDPGGRERRGQEQQHEQRPDHGLPPTTTRLKESDAMKRAATRCTSAAVTRATLAL